MPEHDPSAIADEPAETAHGLTDLPGGEEFALHPTKAAVYSSDQIRERRRKILFEARSLIAEKGLNGFGVRELCQRAGVAQRTLYNAFHSKDRLIAVAIREAYDRVNSNARYSTSADTLDGIIERLIAINTRNRRARKYTLAVAALYFSPDISDDIWRALQHMAFSNLEQWLRRVEAEGDLPAWWSHEAVALNIANLEYAIIKDWAQGRLPDDEFVPYIVRSALSLAAGSTRGKTRDQALRYLEEIDRTGQLPTFPPA